jgi:beta-lactamase superfamily II metal-dependent hydrolase
MADGKAMFVFWDVQHGNACYISSPIGQNIAIDLGVGSYSGVNKTFSPLLYLKNNWQVRRLDAALITHPHRDHLDDIGNFDALNPRVLYRPKHLTHEEIRAGNKAEDSEILEKYFDVDNRYSDPIRPEENPFNEKVNGGMLVQYFTPSKCARTNLNNHSIVTVVGFANSKIIIPGDNEAPSWNELLENPHFVAAITGADILLAAHHGREAGYCENIFKYFSPRLTIVSDGRFSDTSATNRYSSKSLGWKVYKRSGGTEERKCVTTRSDGVIKVVFVLNGTARFIEVTID